MSRKDLQFPFWREELWCCVHSKVPTEYVNQITDNANPPALLIVLRGKILSHPCWIICFAPSLALNVYILFPCFCMFRSAVGIPHICFTFQLSFSCQGPFFIIHFFVAFLSLSTRFGFMFRTRFHLWIGQAERKSFRGRCRVFSGHIS